MLIEKINNATSREEVQELIKNIKKKELIEIMKHYNIYFSNSMTKSELEMRLIEGTIGSRLRFEVLLNLKLNSKY